MGRGAKIRAERAADREIGRAEDFEAGRRTDVDRSAAGVESQGAQDAYREAKGKGITGAESRPVTPTWRLKLADTIEANGRLLAWGAGLAILAGAFSIFLPGASKLLWSAAPLLGMVWNNVGYRRDRPLENYRYSLKTLLLGDPVDNLIRRLGKTADRLDVLDAGSGEGVAAGELKALLGDRIRLDTNDLEPLSRPAGDRHVQGDYLTADFGRQYDVILSMYGALSYMPKGKLIDALQKTASLLKLGGEFAGVVTTEALGNAEGALLKRLSYDFDLRLRFLRAGLVVTVDAGYGGHLLYIKRIGSAELPDIRKLLESPEVDVGEDAAEKTQTRVETALENADIVVDGIRLKAADPEDTGRAIRLIALHFGELYYPDIASRAVTIVRSEFSKFIAQFRQKEGRAPTEAEVEDWARGGVNGMTNPLHVTPALGNVVLQMVMDGSLMLP